MAVPDNRRVTHDALKALQPHGSLRRRINVCPKYDLVYVTNQKVGCSTIKLMLYRAHTGDWSFNPENIRVARVLPASKKLGWPRICDLLSGDAFRFTFVRDPVRRAVSGYNNKLVGKSRKMRAKIQRVLGRPENPEDPVSFDDFLAALEIQDHEAMDPHWRPQYLNVMIDLIPYDLVGRLETFDRDIAELRERTGFPDVPVDHRNRYRTNTPPFDPTRDQKRRLERIYARDFEAFGYGA